MHGNKYDSENERISRRKQGESVPIDGVYCFTINTCLISILMLRGSPNTNHMSTERSKRANLLSPS